ncbi:MAG: hypothetical protein ACM65M_23055 [Microcoleus sp.]
MLTTRSIGRSGLFVNPEVRQGFKPLSHSESPLKEDSRGDLVVFERTSALSAGN